MPPGSVLSPSAWEHVTRSEVALRASMAAGDNVMVMVDGIGSDGKPAHNEWTGKYDGKDYPVTGDANSEGWRRFKSVPDHHISKELERCHPSAAARLKKLD
jgi:hypothetical protein